jgi:hypothetical protein
MKNWLTTISDHYADFQENSLPYRRFSFEWFLELIEKHEQNSKLSISEVGQSIEGRPIHSITWGSGDVHLMFWTQMHGNESTATRAVFDFLNLIQEEQFAEFFKNLEQQVTLKIIPVVNPDGMVRYQRRNALNIDPNRDASRLSTPEMQVLFSQIKAFEPHWCFNMHDQRNLFNVGGTNEPACLSFLSPSTADGKRSKNQNEAMQMIACIHKQLNDFIPGKMGRFTHEYYPTASGDNLQNLGFRTILVESGGYRNDIERNQPRKMNLLLMVETLKLAATKSWKNGTVLRYSEIPANDQKMVDLLIRGAHYKIGDHKIVTDIGIDRVEVAAKNEQGFVVKSSVREIGDLTHYYGYEEFNGQGMNITTTLQLNQTADFDLLDENGNTVEIKNGYIYG